MLETGIVLCVGAIAFLLIRKFPSEGKIFKPKREKALRAPSFSRIFAKRHHVDELEIKDAIVADQEEVVSPKEIETAQQSFDADNPEVAKLLFETSQLIEDQELNSAEEKAISALALDKYCDQAYAFIAHIALKRGEHENAKVAAETALKCSSNNAQAYAVLGEYYLLKEKYSDATENLLKAVMIRRNVASWYGLLGQAYLEVRQFAKSAKAFKRAAGLDLDNREYRRLASIAEEKQMTHSRVYRGK